MTELTDFENMMDMSSQIKSSTATRWERKAKQQNLSGADRYIANRSGTDFDRSTGSSGLDENNERPDSDSEHAKLLLANSKDRIDGSKTRVLAFKNKAPAPVDGYQNSLKVLYSTQGAKKEIVKTTRQISSAPVRVLDAPDMLDDYYLNIMSWSSANVLAVALSQCVYLWNAATSEITELMNVDSDPNDYICSVNFLQEGGSHVAIGTASNTVQLWDVQAGRCVRTMDGHSSRVGSLAWNGHLLASGSKDNSVINHDVRVQNHIVGKMTHHTQEVCGLAWSPDGTYLASGANDNTLCIMDAGSMHTMDAAPRHVLTDHQAAVKALAWSPHERNLLASGGGTADRCIKFWNAQSGAMMNSIDTGSQVCALQWSPFEKEILSSHGYAENQLCLWKYPTMARVKELRGHTSRVLHMATSPDGSMVCSGAADETLRFWNVFGSESTKKKSDMGGFVPSSGLSTSGGLHIR